MAEGIKTGGRDWKPGESGNPGGRPKGTKNKESMIKDEETVERCDKPQEKGDGVGKGRPTLSKPSLPLWAYK